MRARTALVMGCLIMMGGNAAAWGGPSTGTAPAVSVRTYLVTGAVLPVTPISAGWTTATPGCAGSLQASGPAVSGTRTVVTGDFLSRAFRPRNGHLIDIHAQQGGRRLAQPFREPLAVSWRLRSVGHPWSRWLTWSVTGGVSTDPPAASLIFVSETGGGIAIAEPASRPGHRVPLRQAQVRLQDTITSTGIVQDGFTVRFGC